MTVVDSEATMVFGGPREGRVGDVSSVGWVGGRYTCKPTGFTYMHLVRAWIPKINQATLQGANRLQGDKVSGRSSLKP